MISLNPCQGTQDDLIRLIKECGYGYGCASWYQTFLWIRSQMAKIRDLAGLMLLLCVYYVKIAL